MSKLMRSISGIRGIVGDTLTPHVLQSHVRAFLEITKAKRIVIGRAYHFQRRTDHIGYGIYRDDHHDDKEIYILRFLRPPDYQRKYDIGHTHQKRRNIQSQRYLSYIHTKHPFRKDDTNVIILHLSFDVQYFFDVYHPYRYKAH